MLDRVRASMLVAMNPPTALLQTRSLFHFAFNVTNLRLSWTDPRDRFTYSLWSTNLSDERYSTFTTPNVRGDSNGYPQGRQIGVGMAASF